MSLSFRHWKIAKKLGLRKLADRIAERHGPWIEPTPKAVFVLEAAGMWPPSEKTT